jgi:hypothetical protein
MSAVLPERLVRASHLKRQRGWTEPLIAALLGPPDALAPNPHGFRPAMRLFCVRRVLAAEADPAFRAREARMSGWLAWRREQPLRCFAPAELEGCRPLPARLAQTSLFAAPAAAPLPRPDRARQRRRREAAAGPAPPGPVQLRLPW